MRTLFLSIILMLASSSQAAIYVVSSENLKNQTFTHSEVQRILLGTTTRINDKRVFIVYLPYNSAETKKLSDFLGKGSIRKLRAYWSKMIFSGRAIHPIIARNSDEVRDLVMDNDNYFGVTDDKQGLNVVYTIN